MPTQSYQPGMVYDVDIATPFWVWMRDIFTPKFKELHPNDEFAGYILEPGAPGYMPGVTSRKYVLAFSTTDDFTITEGLLANVDHKGGYSLRTGMDSSTASSNLHLVVPGNFPYDGFLTHRGIKGGGSGVRKEFDVVYFREIADKYIELRAGVIAEVIKVIEWARRYYADIGSWKYLEGDLDVLIYYRQAYAEAVGA